MARRYTFGGLLVLGAGLAAAPAMAQTIPMHSGHMGHGSAQMRADGSGIHYPNRPKHHHQIGHAGYRPVHTHAPRVREANEAPYTF